MAANADKALRKNTRLLNTVYFWAQKFTPLLAVVFLWIAGWKWWAVAVPATTCGSSWAYFRLR